MNQYPDAWESALSDLKFLCAGFMKTGLTSLHDTAASLGLRTRHRRRAIWSAFLRGDYETVMAHYETGDFFVDWPHPYMYAPFLKRYGERARIILTLRDSDSWYASLLRHNQHAHPITHSQKFIFGRYYPSGFKDEHIAIYERHNAEVVDYFERVGARDQLLVLNLEDPDKVSKLEAFCGSASRGQTPKYQHSNASAARKHRDFVDVLRKRYNAVIQPLYARWAPRLKPEPGPYRGALDADAV